MKILLPVTAAAALLVLAACDSKPAQPEVIDTNPDPMASQLANAGAVELPPAIKAEKTMRCKDNSVVHVTFFEGDKQAVVQPDKGTPTTLTAATGGEPLVAEGGWKLTGTPANITLEQPGKASLTCKS